MSTIEIRRALVSVYDKTGLDELARGLHEAGVEIVSTGSTAAVIAGAGVPVVRVEELTGFPECLDGRVKTLHPRVHAGLLADTRRPEHRAQLDDLGIAPFELLVSNLYPFEATVASGAPAEQCVQEIDIGGPAMVRAAAKNHASVAVVTDPSQYGDVLAAIRAGGFTFGQRQRLAARAFAHTARYDVAVASWFASEYAPDGTAREAGWPDVAGAFWSRAEVLRYGENPHQRAALYVRAGSPSPDDAGRAPAGAPQAGTGAAGPAGDGGIAAARQLHGKAMSYNNYVDADAARRAAYDFGQPCAAIIKHSNPCGIAIGADLAEAHRQAHACDPVSAFGGVIAVNDMVTPALASQIADVFTEVVIAPAFDPEALAILSKAKNIRLLACPPPYRGPGTEWRPITGGLLMQSIDRMDAPGDNPANWELKTGVALDEGDPRRPGLRLAGVPFGEVERDPAGLRRRVGGHRHGPGQPGRLMPARRGPGRGPGGRLGVRQRRVLPLPGQHRRPRGGRRRRHRRTGRLDPRPPGRRGLRARRYYPVLHRGPPFLPLTPRPCPARRAPAAGPRPPPRRSLRRGRTQWCRCGRPHDHGGAALATRGRPEYPRAREELDEPEG